MSPDGTNVLCRQCGLCCNGVIFADVELQRGDDAARLRSLGLPLKSGSSSKSKVLKFPQPCVFLNGCLCRAYADRPKHCRQFECLLLKRFDAGRIESSAALKSIRQTRRRAGTVMKLLRELGDVREELPLNARFRNVKARMESSRPDDGAAEVFSRLTLAVHELNMMVSESFYPGPTMSRDSRE